MRLSILIIFILLSVTAFGQGRDRSNWTDFGSSHINKWLQVAPNKLGPNALPVPKMDYALVDSMSGFEVGIHSHFMDGDNAVNSFLSFYWCVVPQRVAVEIWGNPSETFNMDNDVRDQRQVFYDDGGWTTNPGDLWISTYIQLLKAKKYRPDMVLNYSAKTTTGYSKHGRYTDAPAAYYYLALGKSFHPKKGLLEEIRVAFTGGFYVWQTNKVEMAQDEGPLYLMALKLKHKNTVWSNEFGGYSGADVYEYIGVTGDNDPLVYRSNLTWLGSRFHWKIAYQTGLRDYGYNTFRFSVAYRFRLKGIGIL